MQWPEPLQFILVNRTVLPFANSQLAVDLSRERFHISQIVRYERFWSGHGSFVNQFRIEQLDDFVDAPKMIRDACFHCRCNAERLMDTGKVVIHVVNRDRVFVIFQLL